MLTTDRCTQTKCIERHAGCGLDCHISLVVEHSLSKREVVGSIPTYVCFLDGF